MEMERTRRLAPPLPAAAAVSLVLGDDDLLLHILLLLGLPTSLVRAALVCRRWYGLASHPAFLHRFRDCHPPRVLGVYLNFSGGSYPRFFQIRPVPELAAAARRAGSFFHSISGSSAFVRDSRGRRLLVMTSEEHYGHTESTHLVCSPLSPAADTVVVPPPPSAPPVQPTDQEPIIYHYGEFLPLNCGGDGRSYSCVLIGYSAGQTTVRLYELQAMYWVLRASSATQLVVPPPVLKVMLLDESKFYFLSTINKILVGDFKSSSISAMGLPDGVVNNDTRSIMLSRGGGSGIFLIHVKESLLRVFHCRTDGHNSGNWSLVENICLRKVCTNLGMIAWTSVEGHDAGVKIHAVGDGAKSMFLEMFCVVVFLDTASTQAEKVYEIRPQDKELFSVHPLSMIWPPPVFRVLKER